MPSRSVGWASTYAHVKLNELFQNTQKRSALRLTRESELLGGQLVAYHTREALVLEANFLRDDLPFFTELLSEVISQTKFTRKFSLEISQVQH